MDGSPRASKRRKLDTPTRNAPSPLAKPSTVRKSARSAARTTYKADGSPKEQAVPPASTSKPAPKRASGTARQQQAVEDADVWDDIEGALGESPTKRLPPALSATKKRVTRKTAVQDTTNENASTDELQKATPSRSKGKKVANGDQDDLTEEAATPSRRASKRAAPASSRRTPKDDQPLKAIDPKPGSLRKPRSSARAQRKLEFEDAMVVATPSSRLKRARQPRFRDDAIPETDDEPDENGATAARTADARRTTRQLDNGNNHSEEVADAGEDPVGADVQEDGDDAMSVDGNSALGSVFDPTEPSPFNKPSSAQKEKLDVPLLSNFVEPGHELDLLKTIVLDRISGKRPVPLVGLDDAYKTVHQLIEHTVTAGEGNSMLLIGARGSGKTALVKKALSEVSKDNSHNFHVIHLNGFIHTDDKIAVRDIWRQLGLEMKLEEENGGVGKSYADALTTLLHLLQHPSERIGEWTEETSTAVIFVMDEFDLFAQHPRQTLLYNLFDIAQSRKAPIAVLGLTTNIDVANHFEKRVKSRFSHRYVHLSLAKTFTAFQEMCKANLLVQPELLSVEERSILESAAKKKTGKQAKPSTAENALSQWNANIHTLFASKSFLTSHLARLYYRSKSIPATLTTFLLPTASLAASLAPPSLTPSNPPDSKLALVRHLSTLALALLIAACRLDIIHDTDTCNFHMAYDEYVALASKARIQSAAGGNSASGGVSKVWGKEVARREWEGLLGLELVMPTVGGLTGGFGMVKCDVSLEEVGAVIAGDKGVEKGLERWCRQI
ncbi:hypothetical protein P171DRAFT_391044 [Karstenula rhodostoma CBS 690.94]|uniref:Origin recognition complex subunit 4 n=1 Tax=Karstenula rhodostoma CBS 690.94 TaxID=1392251 RepID=A0A9P4PGN6_9PLEO|nr:hypothetical protein P171DRAFT_391044 [Karstenula rhodostoma CBS 690.94]